MGPSDVPRGIGKTSDTKLVVCFNAGSDSTYHSGGTDDFLQIELPLIISVFTGLSASKSFRLHLS
jgi:hypothetical protein